MNDRQILQKQLVTNHYDRLIAANPNMIHLHAITMCSRYSGASIPDVTKWLASKEQFQ